MKRTATRHPILVLAAALVAVAVCLALPGRAAADAFVSAIDDLPLMAGLSEAPERTLTFESPAGRIVEAHATGRLSRRSVIDFYAATLPQLGWRQVAETFFRREGETLLIEVTAVGGGLDVQFSLKPAARK